MSKINKTALIDIFSELGHQLANPNESLLAIINDEKQYNAWFTFTSVTNSLKAIGGMLNDTDLGKWLSSYPIDQVRLSKTVGLILAGNIPMVGFHDVLCVLATGNNAMIKASAQDSRLIRYVLQLLITIEPAFAEQFKIVERLENFDAVIATGSNNTSRYFDYYFRKVPNLIRKNRNSLALLTGEETTEQLQCLGRDIFEHYGLGCRNVSKLLVPKGYLFDFFFESIESYSPVIDHHKYNNNYDYNKSIYLVNRDFHFDNGFLLLKEDERIASPLAVLYYEYYTDVREAQNNLIKESDKIQCVVSHADLKISNQVVDFGNSQQPQLWDYADGVDTMAFLSEL